METVLNEMIAIADEISEIVPKEGWSPHASRLSERLGELSRKLRQKNSEATEEKNQPVTGTITADDIQKMVDEARLRILANEV